MKARTRSRLVGLAGGLAGVGAGAWAQDSVSRNSDGGNGLPGDALNAFSSGATQRTAYVVDLSGFASAWGTPFGIAPIVKGGKMGTVRFTALNGPSVASATIRTGQPAPSASYALWTSAGGGVHPTESNAALVTSVAGPSTASVLGVAMLEFCDVAVGSNVAFFNQVVGARVAYDPTSPARLYVERVGLAVNAPVVGQLDRAQFGLGGVDAEGNVAIRADGVLASATSLVLPGENYFRVAMGSRGTILNVIDGTGVDDAGASSWLVNNSGVTHSTPTLIPSDLAGRSVLLGSNFLGDYVHEATPGGMASGTGHRGLGQDHRGAISFSPAAIFPGSVGTGGVIVRTLLAGSNDALSLFGLGADGGVVGGRTLVLPASVGDGCDGFSWPVSGGDFRNYESQVTFRGGNGPVAVGRDQQGRALAAAVVYRGGYAGAGGGTPANPYDAIVVARFDPSAPGSAVAWNAAAWVTSDAADGKDILGDFGADGAPGTLDAGEGDGQVTGLDAPIGRLASMGELGSGKLGPSMSAPMMDGVGNLYFVASVALKRWTGSAIVQDFDTALLRGVYDPATYCYNLDVVLRLGQVFAGANSGRNYQVVSLGLADTDSVSSQAPWSGSIVGRAWNDQSASSLGVGDPRALGGLVLSSRVVYDVNQDGLYQDPTLGGGVSTSMDEAYDVVLYVGNVTPGAPACVADVDDGSGTGTPDGGVTIDDLLFYLTLIDTGDVRADVDDGSGTGTRDGGVTVDDLIYFLARFDVGC